MKKIKLTQTDENIKFYVEEGFTTREISEKMQMHFSTIARSIKKQGLSSNRKRTIKCTEEQEKEIVEMYVDKNMTCQEIQPLYNFLSVDQVNYIVKKSGKTRRNGKRVYFNENFFEKIDTAEKAYFLGLLYADGSVMIIKKSENGFSHKIVLELNTTDKDILIIFNRLLENKNEVYDYQRMSEEYKGVSKLRHMSRIILHSKKMYSDLDRLGKKPMKTETCLSIPNIPSELKSHFIRGYFDGDGSVTNDNKGMSLLIYGTNSFLNSLKESVEELGIKVTHSVHDKKDTNVSMLGIKNREEIEKFYTMLYDNCGDYYMTRRKRKFEELFALIG